jgi:hypothetical protein
MKISKKLYYPAGTETSPKYGEDDDTPGFPLGAFLLTFL